MKLEKLKTRKNNVKKIKYLDIVMVVSISFFIATSSLLNISQDQFYKNHRKEEKLEIDLKQRINYGFKMKHDDVFIDEENVYLNPEAISNELYNKYNLDRVNINIANKNYIFINNIEDIKIISVKSTILDFLKDVPKDDGLSDYVILENYKMLIDDTIDVLIDSKTKRTKDYIFYTILCLLILPTYILIKRLIFKCKK